MWYNIKICMLNYRQGDDFIKIKLKFIIPVILFIVLILCITARPSDDNEIPAGIVSASDIDRIEIKEGDYYFQRYYGYIIDFNENTLTETTETTEGQSKCIKYFSDEDKENFVNKANIYGFF
ncbi:MAG: hypothetical protein NC205_06200 [Prevotella sp.]|nr:hypothetical protein [Alistipes senegalensis]MCM1358169.1 hypothetical protein [Prevotella sp.]